LFHKRQTVHELYFFPKQLKVQLDSIRQYPLTIVEAPSGFGKTTAIQKYLEKISGPASSVYWYTCLNEPPSGIWNGICSLFAKIDGKTAVNLNRLNLPDADALADLSSMIREVRCPSETFLVIDSFQLMKSRIPEQILHAFSVHGNANLHIICIFQPLRDRPEATVYHANIHTIDSRHLLFTRESTGRYARMAGAALTDRKLDSLYNRTEGWISAIRLQLQQYQETGTFARTQGLDQLVETAFWNTLANEEKEFILDVSVLDEFTTRQAQKMLNQKTLPDNIQHLLDSNEFIHYFPEKDLYTLHRTIQNYLRGRFFNQKSKEYQTQTLRRAAKTCSAIADYYSAALFYYRISDYDAVLNLPLDMEYLSNQRERKVLDFIVDFVLACPEEILCRHPRTIMIFALQLYMDGRCAKQRHASKMHFPLYGICSCADCPAPGRHEKLLLGYGSDTAVPVFRLRTHPSPHGGALPCRAVPYPGGGRRTGRLAI
jgi:LuxR family maltose regulon positive regulatory protein